MRPIRPDGSEGPLPTPPEKDKDKKRPKTLREKIAEIIRRKKKEEVTS